jgi:serine/threonine protein kinase
VAEEPIGWNQGAYALASIGPTSAGVVGSWISEHGGLPLEDVTLRDLERSLSESFDDAQAADLLLTIFEMSAAGADIPAVQLKQWMRAHAHNPASVIECLKVTPPPGITISQLLSRAGSQKLVFLADWKLQQREIVLKRLITPLDERSKIVEREIQAHPLKFQHPHIIQTHFMSNESGEVFLVEERLSQILGDGWRAGGTEQASNLLSEMASALDFLHSNHNLVHGDIKPDNIGIREEQFVLLDFGIARPADEYTGAVTPTGSLRTRAPELLCGDRIMDPKKVDVWALGATVFNSLIGRFPLFREDDPPPPRITRPDERAAFETKLQERISNEWDALVDLQPVDEPLRSILARSLERDPENRAGSDEIVEYARTELQAYIRSTIEGGLSPLHELDQLLVNVDLGAVDTMPIPVRYRLVDRLKALRALPPCEGRSDEVDRLLVSLSPPE